MVGLLYTSIHVLKECIFTHLNRSLVSGKLVLYLANIFVICLFLFSSWFGILGNSKKSVKQKWNPEEMEAIFKELHAHVISDTVPGKQECESLKSRNKCLRKRKWSNIKDFVRNHNSKLRKNK